jgi:antagonist of KipI
MVARPPEIISAPLAPGTIQLPASGTPILAMRDCPTIGGYPRVAAILTEDLVRVAQFKPGDTLRFELLRR